MRVKNEWKRPIRVGRQVIPRGAVVEIPDQLLLQPRVQKLRKTGKLVFPYREEKPEPKPVPVVEPKHTPVGVPDEPPKPDDLTQLIHIGAGRSKNLNTFGIFTFSQVLEHGNELQDILEITEDMAEEIVADAETKVG